MKIREIVVVEGIHDKQAVERAVDADVWVIGGDRIAKRFLTELRRASDYRGVIVLTDPDGPGERIRRRINDAVPHCKHAFLPKATAVSRGSVGVEHASPLAIMAALEDARPTVEAGASPSGPFTMEHLVEGGLAGGAASAKRRERVGDILGIGTANAKSFLRKLNVLGISVEEWEAALDAIGKDSGDE